jgi:hypothetical protein
LRGDIIWEITGDYIEAYQGSDVIRSTPLVFILTRYMCSASTNIDSPELQSPVNNSCGNSLETEFQWSSVGGANSYDLQVSLNSTFSPLYHSKNNISATFFTLSDLDANTKYYWHMRVKNSSQTSDWSSIFNFTTLFNAPELLLPVDNTHCTNIDMQFKWNAVEGVVSYNLLLATDDDFNDIIEDISDIDDTLITINDLDNSKMYYWKVRAIGDDCNGDWSDTCSFETHLLPPDLLAPSNNIECVNISMNLKWKSVNRANVYELLVFGHSDFSDTLRHRENLRDTTYRVGIFQGLLLESHCSQW